MTTLILDRRNNTLYADQQETYYKHMKLKCRKLVPFYINNTKWGWAAMAGDSEGGEIYLRWAKGLTAFDDIYINSDTRPKFKDISGFLVNAKEQYIIHEHGSPAQITDDYFAAGCGSEMAMVLLDVGIPVPEIFKIINNRSGMVSKEFDYVEYAKKNAQIIYNQTA